MMQKLLFLDFETYYDDEYSLRKMSPANYILDRRFECILCAVKEDNQPGYVVDGPDFPCFVRSLDPAQTITVAFNALFDNCILAWRYGFVPARMLCSMRMAVALRGHILRSASLAAIGERLGVGCKGTTIESVKALHRTDIQAQPALAANFHQYALNDNEMNAALFWKLVPEFPASERKIMDCVLRCAIEPEFQIDVPMLQQHLAEVSAIKALTLNAAGVQDIKDVRSGARFAELLQARGIDIEYKTTPTGNRAPAFAKTDAFMATLQENPDPVVQALAAARLGSRSTIEETRGNRMLSIAQLPWERYSAGNGKPFAPNTMPIPLRYSGAHTHRLSGDWLINMQNLPSGRGTQISKLRKALKAPDGHEVVVGDLAQIEARINAWICGEASLLKLFATGADPYSVLASAIFGYHVDKINFPLERFIGKSGELGLGFRCGPDRFYSMVIRLARQLGMDMDNLLRIWVPALAQKAVGAYRFTHSNIQRAWYQLDDILSTAWCGFNGPQKFGPGGVVEIGEGHVMLPNGMKLLYDVVCRDPSQDLTYRYGGKGLIHKMHGGIMLENIVQALARIVIMNAALRLRDMGYWFKMQVHDELVFIIRASEVAAFKALLQTELCRSPSWGLTIPLNCDIGSGATYGDAK